MQTSLRTPWKKWCLFMLFLDNLAELCFGFIDIAGLIQYTYIVGKYKIHLHSLWNRPEKLSRCPLFYLFLRKNVREYRRCHQKWIILRNWQHRIHKTKKNKTKTQHNKSLVRERLKSYPRVSVISLSCTPPVLDYICVLLINIRSLPSSP